MDQEPSSSCLKWPLIRKPSLIPSSSASKTWHQRTGRTTDGELQMSHLSLRNNQLKSNKTFEKNTTDRSKKHVENTPQNQLIIITIIIPKAKDVNMKLVGVGNTRISTDCAQEFAWELLDTYIHMIWNPTGVALPAVCTYREHIQAGNNKGSSCSVAGWSGQRRTRPFIGSWLLGIIDRPSCNRTWSIWWVNLAAVAAPFTLKLLPPAVGRSAFGRVTVVVVVQQQQW